LMLIGMAFYKWGILSAQRSKKFYRSLLLAGFGGGLPLIIFGIMRNFQANWDLKYSMYLGHQFNYWGSVLVIFGYIGAVMLICKKEVLGKIASAFAAAGRMAFTNYLVQSFVCTILFYGHGFGLYGTIERTGQILIVFGIWILQLILSPLWLKYFRFGPFEWAWRSLTYWKLQKFKMMDSL
jgi:uncharacterized protein